MSRNNGTWPYLAVARPITVADFDRSVCRAFNRSNWAYQLNATPETQPAGLEIWHRRIMTAITVRQLLRLTATAQQHKLLPLSQQFKRVSTDGQTIGKPGRTPAAAQQQRIARLYLAYLG
jgi:hypothetical protein